DVVGALCKLIKCDDAVGEVINVGTQESITINALAEKILQLTGSDSTIRHLSYEEAYGRPFDDLMVRVPDLAKINRLIGYEPKHNLDETLQQVIEFERKRL
ncbi:MAG: nucleoside-diphosphate sugar epimerase, partial [Phycisphaerae bacterium]|nr:nucleoside-diphosphate sugar epimerase [Phycisphaerae bacterium]